jgi:signal transduction histidine kinase
MPLRLRLALLFALATAAVIAVAGAAFVLQLRVSVEASLDPGLRAQAAAVADELEGDDEPGPLPSGTAVQITAPDGTVVTTSPQAGSSPVLTPAQLQRARSGEVSFTTTLLGDRSRVLAVAMPAGSGRVITVATGTDVADAAVERAELALLLGGPPAVLLAGAGAYLLAGAVLRPVERMRRQAAEISDRDVDRRLAVPATRDEIAALGTTMNALLSRLQQALARERGFVADAGHELRTPLAILRTELELAARPGRSRRDLVEAVTLAGEETDRLIRLAEGLLLLAQADNHQPFLRRAPASLRDLLRSAARGSASRAADRDVTVALQVPEPLWTEVDPDRLRQAVDNLLDNAIRHAPPGGAVELSALSPRPGTVAITVADDGPGFPPEFLPYAFERFHRAEASRSRDIGGAGLGLSIVLAIVQAHDGRVLAANRADGGAVVTIELPVSLGDGPPEQLTKGSELHDLRAAHPGPDIRFS